MHVSEHPHSKVNSLSGLTLAEFSYMIFALKDRLDPFAFLKHHSLQQLKPGARRKVSCHRKTEMTRPATPPCGHVDELVCHRACHSREPKARREENTAGSPVTGAARSHQPTRLGPAVPQKLLVTATQSQRARQGGEGAGRAQHLYKCCLIPPFPL